MYKAPKTGQLGLFDGSSWQVSNANSIGILEVFYDGDDFDRAINDALDKLSNWPHRIIAIPRGLKL